MLYMGYVGMSVVLVFAIAALIGGRLDATWRDVTALGPRSPWMFLTCGIALGSFWTN
jgi:cytochrome c-type biogenesis protein CcmF